jgi:hypothetical protein
MRSLVDGSDSIARRRMQDIGLACFINLACVGFSGYGDGSFEHVHNSLSSHSRSYHISVLRIDVAARVFLVFCPE